jgi:hypothetical protein
MNSETFMISLLLTLQQIDYNQIISLGMYDAKINICRVIQEPLGQ